VRNKRLLERKERWLRESESKETKEWQTGEMRRNIGILPRVEKGKKSCKQQQRERKLRRSRRERAVRKG
jgi:hypothetical protein